MALDVSDVVVFGGSSATSNAEPEDDGGDQRSPAARERKHQLVGKARRGGDHPVSGFRSSTRKAPLVSPSCSEVANSTGPPISVASGVAITTNRTGALDAVCSPSRRQIANGGAVEPIGRRIAQPDSSGLDPEQVGDAAKRFARRVRLGRGAVPRLGDFLEHAQRARLREVTAGGHRAILGAGSVSEESRPTWRTCSRPLDERFSVGRARHSDRRRNRDK
jgi:hypothetical protein